MRSIIQLSVYCVVALAALFPLETRKACEAGALTAWALEPGVELTQDSGNLVYADFETASDGRPVSSRRGLVQLYAYQQQATFPSHFKGLASANPPAPEFVRLSKDSTNRAIAFDYELQGTNDYAGVGVEVHGQAHEDGKAVADDVSSYKFLALQLYVTGVSSITVEFISHSQGIEISKGSPQMSFKVSSGFNTYKVPLNSLTQPSWADVNVKIKDVLKKLTSVNVLVSCTQCTTTKGTVVIDNVVFQN